LTETCGQGNDLDFNYCVSERHLGVQMSRSTYVRTGHAWGNSAVIGPHQSTSPEVAGPLDDFSSHLDGAWTVQRKGDGCQTSSFPIHSET
jgi:hypothetical protein